MPSKHKLAHWRYNTVKGQKRKPTTHVTRALTIEKTEFIGRNFALNDYDHFRKPNPNPNPLRVKWGYNTPVTSSELQDIFKTNGRARFQEIPLILKFFECQKAPKIKRQVERSESLTVPSPHGRNSVGTLESLDEESEYEDLNESQDIVFNDGRKV